MPSLQYRLNRFLIKSLYPKADLCLSNSYGNMIDLKNNFNITKLAYIHNLFNLDMIEKISKEEIEKKRFTFVTVGRLDHGKNHRLVIDAIDADLWIIGDGELKEEYIRVQKLENKVYLLGKSFFLHIKS
ncbi:glycosyltransferase family protein [Aliarcobacter butzleri]|uniref:hypothetical protein n=1 Tax=Aliarcobacter butzleri TaxID=28197 RepID=UPI001D02ADA1|nr:hypothetical protein [Aliarcobacter butzleri]